MSNAGRKKLPREIKEARVTLEKSREHLEDRVIMPLIKKICLFQTF